MRILMLSHGYPPAVGGVTLVAQNVARAMVRRGHQAAVVCASELREPYRASDQGVEIIRVRSTGNPFRTGSRVPILSHERLKEIVSVFQPDVIHTHDTGLLALQLLRLELDGYIPQLATCHFLPRFVRNYLDMGERVDRFAEAITWGYAIRMLNRFDHVVFPTLTQKQAFMHRGLRIPSTVISNGVDIDRYRPRKRKERVISAWDALPDGPRLLYHGRLTREQNIEVLIRAIPLIREASRAHLLLAGRGEDRERLAALVSDLGLSGQVHFLGFVPGSDLPALYREVDLFVIPAQRGVQSASALRAAASGLPIVAVRAAPLTELARHAVNGLLVEAGNVSAFARAALRILTDPWLAARFSRASRAIARRHDQERTVHAYERLYRQLAQDRRRSAWDASPGIMVAAPSPKGADRPNHENAQVWDH